MKENHSAACRRRQRGRLVVDIVVVVVVVVAVVVVVDLQPRYAPIWRACKLCLILHGSFDMLRLTGDP